LHIPRALRVVYDVRNNRDAAHLADGIDPNLQDASLVISVLDWVLAEFVRLFHNVTADQAQVLVQGIVTREAPAVEDFDGFLKVLKVNLSASSFVLLLLYQRGADGATFDELNQWARPTMRRNLRHTLHRLVNDQAFVHATGTRFQITRSGQKEVERLELIRVD
jgi:chitinase